MKKKDSMVNKDRSEAENSEDLRVQKVDAPDQRFQTDQQEGAMHKTQASVDIEPFKRKTVKSKGQTLKQEVVAEVLSDKGIGGGASASQGVASPAKSGLKAASFSGDTGTLLGNVSGTPSMGRSYQGESRIDKRLSDANKDINFNASEQVLVEYDNIPPLAASESTVGYNGNPKNVAARSQKKTGYTPAEMLYDRSLDMIEKDGFVYSTGQVVKQSAVGYNDYPVHTLDEDGKVINFTQVRGNYSPRNLEIKVKRNASTGRTFISSFKVEEDDLSCNSEVDMIANQAATNHLIDMNRAELARQTIDADAGSPTSEHFNALGRSVDEPTATVAVLQDTELVTGAEVFTSYKFAVKARAHFLNRTAKDGQDLTGPAIDALYGHLCGAVDLDGIKAALGDLTNGGYFSVSGMRAGSAALMVPLFDSIAKYKTKADLVNQPRGIKMHLQTADNNMDPFRCKKEFVAALNSVDAYSTIDHDYDPTAPVYILDNVRLIHPYSWTKALAFTRDDNGVKTYTSVPFRYQYAAGSGMNQYRLTVGEPVLNGVAYFLDLHANEIFNATKGNSNDSEITINIPIVHSTTHFSLWDLLVCASTPYIIYERTNALKDILDYEMFYKYPLQGTVRIQDANPLNAVNYGALSPMAAIQVKQMLPSNAIRWKYPETWIRLGEDQLAPYYFNERGFDVISTSISGSKGSATLRQNGECEFTTPVVRSGYKLQGLDDFFGMEVKDQLLITDRLVRMPGNVDPTVPFAAHIYKYGQESDGLIVIENAFASGVTAADVYSTPRLLGFYADAPAGVCQVYDGQQSGGEWVPALGKLTALTDINLISLKPSFRAIQYKGVYADGEVIVSRPLQVGSVNVNRGQAFTQIWGMKWAGQKVKSKYFDLVLSINESIAYNDELGHDPRFVVVTDKAQFSPYVYGPYAVSGSGANRTTTNTAYSIGVKNRPILFAPHLMLWTLLQKTDFVINPFENSDAAQPAADPFGVAYLFGLAGFMAANYNEEIYNRANMYQNEGYGYTVDPMTQQSPVFKDAYRMTEIG